MKTKILLSLFLIFFYSQVFSQNPDWTYIRKDNTGIGGMTHGAIVGDAFNNIWTGGYESTNDEGSLVRIKTNDTLYTNWGTYNENYLPNGFIYDIAFDATGIIWVATENGVATSGDGLVWQHYDSSNSPLLSNEILALDSGSADNLWLVTAGNGVGYFNGTVWEYYTSANSGLPTVGFLKDIAVDANDIKWVASDSGLIKYDGTDWTQYTIANSGLSSNDISEIKIDGQNRIWALVGNAIDIFDGTNWTQINESDWGVPNFYAFTMDIRGDHILLTGNNTRLLYFDGTDWHEEFTNFSMYDSFIDSDYNYWVSGSGVVAMFDGAEYTKYTQYNTGLPENFNNDIFIDSQGRYWFANGGGGIQVFDCPNWEAYGPNNEGLYPNPQTLFSTTIGTSITEDGDGDIWFTYDGTSGYAIQIPDGNYQDYAAWITWDNTNSHPALQFPEEIEATDDGKVFVRGGNINTFMYDKIADTWMLWDFSNGLTGVPYSLGARGNAMYLGHYQGIDIYENGVWASMDLSSQGIDHVLDIKFDSNDNMWLATPQGLWKYDGANWTNWNEVNSNIAADRVNTIAIDVNDIVYISAHNTQIFPYYGGISYFDGTGNTFTTFLDGSSPLAHKQVEDIAVDGFGNIWALTQSEGFSIYNPNGISGFECVDRTLERTLGVQEFNSEQFADGFAHPNPFSNLVTVSFISKDSAPVTLKIYDILGREIKSILVNAISVGKNEISLSLGSESSGMYFCKLSANGTNKTIKLLKY